MIKAKLARGVERIWWSRRTPPLPLRLLAPVYRAVSRRHLARRAARQTPAPAPLISIGNITAGGSGKTPFARWLCEELARAGLRPALLCRGDGGSLREPRHVRPGDDPALHGDEAVMLARMLEATGAPVIAAKDRVAGARLAADCGDVIVLDDGFQYRQIARDCDIALAPAEGCGNGWMIPAGPLREPVEALARADLIVRTGEGDATPLGPWREWRWRTTAGELARIAPGAEESVGPPSRAAAICAIARPERFFAMLRRCGIKLAAEIAFPDHHMFTRDDLRAALAALPPDLPCIATAKDEAKLLAVWPEDRPLWRLDLAAESEPGLLEAILARLGKDGDKAG